MEFAASAIVLFTLLFGIVECSRAVYIYHFVGNAAQEAAHYAMVRGASWTAGCASATSFDCTAGSRDISGFVHSLATAGVASADLGVSASWPGTTATGASCLLSSSTPPNTAGCVVQVKVTYTFSFLSPLLPEETLSLASTSEVTIVQ